MLEGPFICIATQNPVGAAGTQMLPESQLDRFMVRLSIGYPDLEAQLNILQAKKYSNPLDNVKQTTTRENILDIQQYLSSIQVERSVLTYAIALCEATRNHPLIELGVSPRGVLALVQMAKAHAVLAMRSYLIPEDVQQVFQEVCGHRLVLKPQARMESVTQKELLDEILLKVKPGIF